MNATPWGCSGFRRVPGVLRLDSVGREGLDDGLVGERDGLHVSHGFVGRIQAHRHELVHGCDDGVLDFDRVVELFFALGRDAVVLELGLGELLAGGQGLEQFRRGLVDFLGDGERPVDALAGGQTRLDGFGDLDRMVDCLDQYGLLVTLDVAAAFDFSLCLTG